MQSPTWYRRRSAIFALVFAIGFLGGWAISFMTLGRYEPAFAAIGAHWGPRGVLLSGLAALVLVLLAMVVRIWGASYLSASTAWEEDARTDALIVAGPFRFVRHPLYCGNVLLAMGLGAAAPVFGWAFIVIVNILFVQSLARYEDNCLAGRYHDAFETYRRDVPAMLPRLRPVPARDAVHPSLKQGLRSEAFTLFVLAGVIAVFTLPRYGPFVLVGCYVAGVLVQRRIERV